MTANPPLYGQHGEATYRDPEIPAYAGNPLIESLPSIQSRSELIGELGHFPNFSTADREKPAQLRLLMLDELETLYQPLNKGIQIAQTIDGMIRSGYRGRNPLERTFWKDIDQRATDMATPYITDYAVSFFRDAQKWAIQNGTETLTEHLIAEVAAKTRPLSLQLREAFARGDAAAAELVGDVNLSGRDAPSPLPPNHTQTQQSASTKKPSPKPKPTSLVSLPEDSLVSIGERGKEAGISAYEALLKADHIRSPREFLHPLSGDQQV